MAKVSIKQPVTGGGGGGITSVNGYTGPVVVLTTTDINEGTNLYFTNERAQDAVGNILTNTATINWTYDDPSNTISAAVVANTTNQKVGVSLNGTLLSTRKEINFIEGTDIDISVADNGGSDRVDVTINSTVSGVTGTPNTFAGYDSLGDLYTLPNWVWNTDTTGVNWSNNITPPDPGVQTTWVLNSFVGTVNPSANLTNLDFQGLQNFNYLVGPSDFSDWINFNNGMEVSGQGDKGDITLTNEYFQIGDGVSTTAADSYTLRNSYNYVNNLQDIVNAFKGDSIYLQVGTGGTVGYVTAHDVGVRLEGTSDLNANLYSGYYDIDFDQPTGVGINHASFNSTVDGDIGFFNGVIMGGQIGNATAVTVGPGTQIFSSSLTLYSGSTINGFTGFQETSQFNTGSFLTSAYSGVNINPNISADLTGTGANIAFFGGTFTNDIDYINGVSVNPAINTGAVVANGITVIQDGSQIQTGVTADYYTGIGSFPNFNAGCVIDFVNIVNVNATTNANLDSVVLGNFGGGGTGIIDSIKGLQVNVSSILSGAKKYAADLQGGSFQSSYEVHTDDFTFSIPADQVNGLTGTVFIEPGFPIPSGNFVFGNNLGVQLVAEDDMDVDVLGGVLGFSIGAFVGQYAVATTKVVDTMNFVVAAGSVPDVSGLGITDGGTITNVVCYRAGGLFEQGGNLNIDNIYGFKVESLFGSSPATNFWGLHVGADIENYIQGTLAIGTATEKVANSSVALEIESTSRSFLNARMTTAQRNALTALAGMQIFNTDLTRLEFYDGTNWITL